MTVREKDRYSARQMDSQSDRSRWREGLIKPESQADSDRQLIPQFFFICLGMGGASLYLIRLAKGPHVIWNKTNNPEPWNKLDPTYQYKFVAINTDYENLKKEGPEY